MRDVRIVSFELLTAAYDTTPVCGQCRRSLWYNKICLLHIAINSDMESEAAMTANRRVIRNKPHNSMSYITSAAYRRLLVLCRSRLSSYIAIVRNRFLVNNSGIPEPISMKFYTVMGIQMGRSGNFGRPRQMAAKTAQKRTFCQEDNASEIPFLGVPSA